MIIRKLLADDATQSFSCGQAALDQYPRRYAWGNQRADGARTYVAAEGAVIAGYYSLCAGGIEWAGVPERVGRGLARHAIQVMLLARLAVDLQWQNRGIGKALLRDALLRTLQAADIAGIRAILVHAKDDAARRWYLRWDFEPSPSDPRHLLLLVKDARQALR
jgi:GNAT superfamily N-acetyltransferase